MKHPPICIFPHSPRSPTFQIKNLLVFTLHQTIFPQWSEHSNHFRIGQMQPGSSWQCATMPSWALGKPLMQAYDTANGCLFCTPAFSCSHETDKPLDVNRCQKALARERMQPLCRFGGGHQIMSKVACTLTKGLGESYWIERREHTMIV